MQQTKMEAPDKTEAKILKYWFPPARSHSLGPGATALRWGCSRYEFCFSGSIFKTTTPVLGSLSLSSHFSQIPEETDTHSETVFQSKRHTLIEAMCSKVSPL